MCMTGTLRQNNSCAQCDFYIFFSGKKHNLQALLGIISSHIIVLLFYRKVGCLSCWVTS